MRFTRFAEIVSVIAGEHEIANQVQQQRVKDFEAVGIVDEVRYQYVVF